MVFEEKQQVRSINIITLLLRTCYPIKNYVRKQPAIFKNYDIINASVYYILILSPAVGEGQLYHNSKRIII